MTVSDTVSTGEGGRLRLYALSQDRAEAAALRAAFAQDAPDIGAQVGAALGTGPLEGHWLTLVPVSDVRAIGFDTYLRSGHDVPDDQIAAARARLDAVSGHVLIVQSPAFGGSAHRLSPADWLEPMAEFDTIRDPGPARDMPRAAHPDPVSAQGRTPPAPPRRAMPPLVLLLGLLAAGAIVAALAVLGGR
ncbi:hypothetical protein DKT77_16555 [Meridianimarinicoccus roseus]|uniref:Uncharacterized protein n=1 Tax=Meridianimarinicoccus roseus TaxID=2072018 RepID=A0A2V2LIP9_9RHOB|nr:hypothetical protein [Meridianimarinicoccus roseus]PWR01723.1 hypothetical protein DKT77_16555 [Meridianimarinicoccus roseus]